MKKYLFLVLLSTSLYSQIQSSEEYMKRVLNSTKTPNGFMFTDYSKEGNVDVATGRFGITIPFTTIDNEYLSLPISLAYSTSGVKVDENASEIGMGWNLLAGGQITRKVNGQADDVNIVGDGDATSLFVEKRPANAVIFSAAFRSFVAKSNVIGSARTIYNDILEYDSGSLQGYNEFYSKYFPLPRKIWYNNGTTLVSDYPMISILDMVNNSGRVETQRDIFHVAIGDLNFRFIIKIKDEMLPKINEKSNGRLSYGNFPNQAESYYEAVALDDTGIKIEIIQGYSYDYYSRTVEGQMVNYLTNFFKGFIVTDKKGIKYYFDNFLFTEPEHIRTMVGFDDFNPNGKRFIQGLMRDVAIDNWVISKIVFPDNDIIQFEYQKKRIAEQKIIPREHDGEYTGYSYNLRPPKTGYGYDFTNYRYEKLYIKKIISRKSRIEFNYYDDIRIDLKDGMRLKNIQLYNIQNLLIKQFDLISDYKGAATSDNYLSKRLFLEKLIEKSIIDRKTIQYDTTKDTEYNFDYYNPNDLPSKNAIGFQDLYGYYLGNTIENSYPQFPQLYINPDTEGNKISYYPIKSLKVITFNGVNRIPNANTLHFGALKEIKFPTKGSLLIEYEPNQFYNDATVERNPTGPGCRVKFLKYFNHNNSPIKTKKYNYQLDYQTSSGISLHKPSYAYIANYVVDNSMNFALEENNNPVSLIDYWDKYFVSKESLNLKGITAIATLYNKLITISTHPTGPQSDIFGRDILYTVVAEEDISVLDNISTNGKTKYYNYYMDNRSEVNVISGPTNDVTYISPCSKNVLASKGISSTGVGTDFGGGTPDIFPWQTDGCNCHGGIKVKYGFVEKKGKDIFPFPDRNYFDNNDALKIGKTYKIEYLTTINNFDGKLSEKIFTYNLQKNQSYKTLNFDINYKDTFYHLADNVKIARPSAQFKPGLYFYTTETLYTNQKMVLTGEESRIYAGYDSLNNPAFISQGTNYLFNKYFQPSETQIWNSRSLVQNKFYYPFDTSYSINLQTELQKLIAKNRMSELIKEETFVDGIKTKTILKPFKEFPVATFNTYPFNFTINLTMPAEIHSNKGEYNIDESQTTDLKVTYNKYDPAGNLTEYSINSSGISNVIIWGYNYTLPIAKIENATYASITPSLITAAQNASDTGTEATLISALNAIRTALPDAMVTTYTHIPLIGVSTVTDPKGDKTTYNYDSFGRLQNVTDKNNHILSENEYHYKN